MKNLKMKKEFKVIADLLPNNTRVLDVGCGDGSLMNFLLKEKNIEVRGLELNQNNVQQCIIKVNQLYKEMLKLNFINFLINLLTMLFLVKRYKLFINQIKF